MKFLCPKCERLVDLRDFQLEGTTLVVTCPACGHGAKATAQSTHPQAPVPLAPVVPATVTGERPALQLTSYPGTSNVVALRSPGADAITAAAEAAEEGPFEVPDGRCPKCIAPRQPNSPTCSQCGLAFAQFDPTNLAVAPWLEGAWVALLADWGNEAKHAEVRARAQAELDLASVGRLYRLRLAAHGEDPFAQRGRDEVLRMALVPGAKVEPASLVTQPIDPKWKYVVIAVALVLSLVVLGVMARAMLTPE